MDLEACFPGRCRVEHEYSARTAGNMAELRRRQQELLRLATPRRRRPASAPRTRSGPGAASQRQAQRTLRSEAREHASGQRTARPGGPQAPPFMPLNATFTAIPVGKAQRQPPAFHAYGRASDSRAVAELPSFNVSAHVTPNAPPAPQVPRSVPANVQAWQHWRKRGVTGASRADQQPQPQAPLASWRSFERACGRMHPRLVLLPPHASPPRRAARLAGSPAPSPPSSPPSSPPPSPPSSVERVGDRDEVPDLYPHDEDVTVAQSLRQLNGTVTHARLRQDRLQDEAAVRELEELLQRLRQPEARSRVRRVLRLYRARLQGSDASAQADPLYPLFAQTPVFRHQFEPRRAATVGAPAPVTASLPRLRPFAERPPLPMDELLELSVPPTQEELYYLWQACHEYRERLRLEEETLKQGVGL